MANSASAYLIQSKLVRIHPDESAFAVYQDGVGDSTIIIKSKADEFVLMNSGRQGKCHCNGTCFYDGHSNAIRRKQENYMQSVKEEIRL